MKSHLNASAATVRQRMMEFDGSWRLHVLDAIEALQEADDCVRCFCEGELFYAVECQQLMLPSDDSIMGITYDQCTSLARQRKGQNPTLRPSSLLPSVPV